MTSVAAWIELEEDADVAVARGMDIAGSDLAFRRIVALPDRTRLVGGWIYGLQAWAAERRITVGFGADALDISMRLRRNETHELVQQSCDVAAAQLLRAEIDAVGNPEAHFKIRAEEF
ncbi:hypothetical protein [Paraburkholderia caledonica]|uniref:Uncharacterized protein n=1 Tax=Paraburkholderia caledonica TaxID=134536 RepID=A0AB73I608_9BURK|nr:hypothetical protein [Paraburkholderia caledonica]